jgi:hypothetical protein
MSDDIRYQQKCYYASPKYCASFWGKFIFIYQGKGSLRATLKSLCLEGCPQAIEIPFQAVKSIGLGRFSVWSKPFGLSYLIVRYMQDGEPRAINLIPCTSARDPTWETSKLVASWYETLGRVEELTNRMEPPQFDQASLHSFTRGLAVKAVLLIIPLAVLVLIAWLINRS